MTNITLDAARTIVAAARAKGQEMGLKPLTVAVLDTAGNLKALEREDGSSNMRPDIAIGKAMNELAGGSLVPVAGGVLIKDDQGAIIGACGITGDISDNDETAAIAGIEAAGFVADGG